MTETDYDVALDRWPWSDIFPCPVTGCWLNTTEDVPRFANRCGQACCCNPEHCASDVPAAIDERGMPEFAAAWMLAPRFDLATAVAEHVRAALARHQDPSAVVCFDGWAARIGLGVVATLPRSAREVEVSVVEPTDELIEWAVRRDLPLIRAQRPRPATVVIAPRLGTAVAEVQEQATQLGEYCDAGTTIVWSRSLRWPDLVAEARSVFGVTGFVESTAELVGRRPLLPGWFLVSGRRVPAVGRLAAAPAASASIRADIAGVVLETCVAVGDQVRDGDVVALLESMKMEIPVIAEVGGAVTSVSISVGQFVPSEGLVATLTCTTGPSW